MTARRARTISSLAAAVLLSTTACTSYFEIPVETPIRPRLDTSAFQRILIAGFISGGTEEIDGNLETARLLRSQLRTRSSLNVIDTDVLPLMEAAGATNGDGGSLDPAAVSLIRDEKDLEPYEHIFANVDYWKRIGEEFQEPLIVTGTVMFTPHQRNLVVQRDREEFDSFGRRRTVAERAFVERKGFVLRPKFIFIDGRTGTVLHSENFREEILYNANQVTPALSSYFELMDRLIPSFLSTLSNQKVKGTRVLLR